ncbi:MAG: TldD/PmbA family protein, partial [Leptospiraceae bacterium]|nr:TldD/PmbA family protein [Leptospiraceae bacterium]
SELPYMSEKELVDVADRVISSARSDSRIRLDRVEVALVRDTRSILNSHGIELSMRRAYVTWSAMGMARDGEQVTSFDYDGGVAFQIPEIEGRIQNSMDRFRESVLGSLNPLPGHSYQGQVLLHPALVRQFLLGAIAYNANGKNQQDGVSTWNGRQGSPVTSAGINIFEDPLDINRPETFLPFDREGLLTAKHHLVENGKLCFTGHNIYSARRAGQQPTGNASGGASGTPGVGFTNVKIDLDGLETDSLEGLMKRMKRGLLIKRFSGNADPSSGHFSGVAKNSYWIENGSVAHPVQEIMVAGNLFQLMQQIVAGTNIDFEIMGGSRAPYLVVDGISVTAG